jgi:hypothetical protein
VCGGRVWLAGRAVDVVSRMWLLDHLLEPGAAELLDPLLGAAARGEVAMFTPLDSELFGSEASLAMLSDERNRHLFSAAERASIDAILPWTRMMRPGPVTLEDGQSVDLLDYAVAHRDDLVLKATPRYGGQDVLPGWDAGTSPQRWREELASAMGRPVRDPAPDPAGGRAVPRRGPRAGPVDRRVGRVHHVQRLRRHHRQGRHGGVRAGRAQRGRRRASRLLPGGRPDPAGVRPKPRAKPCDHLRRRLCWTGSR